MNIVAIVCPLACAALVCCHSIARPDYKRMKVQLLSAFDADQEAEKLIVQHGGPDRVPADIGKRIAEGRAEREALLQEIIDQIGGWPGWKEVGTDASHAAWIIAQHADAHVEQQKHFLLYLRRAVAARNASPEDLAYLEDRVRVAEDRPQLYGTQLRITNGRCRLYPVDDIEKVNDRRKRLNMPPVEQYVREVQAFLDQNQ